MKIPKFPMRKKMRATTASRRSSAPIDEMDYEEMSEPNMKLSRALLIVLVLHVVAVAGIIAFNTIKSRQGTLPTSNAPETAVTKAESTPPAPPKGGTAALASAANSATLPSRDEVAPAAPQVAKALPAEPVKTTAKPGPSEDGKYYIVAKGDNPVSIAKKLKVSQYELLAANGITDPTKLQIGQKLLVPPQKSAAKSTPKSKKSDG
jgi:LysM repeat protein